jgi:hypothetical protein
VQKRLDPAGGTSSGQLQLSRPQEHHDPEEARAAYCKLHEKHWRRKVLAT